MSCHDILYNVMTFAWKCHCHDISCHHMTFLITLWKLYEIAVTFDIRRRYVIVATRYICPWSASTKFQQKILMKCTRKCAMLLPGSLLKAVSPGAPSVRCHTPVHIIISEKKWSFRWKTISKIFKKYVIPKCHLMTLKSKCHCHDMTCHVRARHDIPKSNVTVMNVIIWHFVTVRMSWGCISWGCQLWGCAKPDKNHYFFR